MITRGFTGRQPTPDIAKRLPSGQSLTADFPVHCPTVANKTCKGAIGSAHLLLSTRAPHLSGTSGFARSPPSRRAFGPPQDEDSFLPNGWRAEKRNPMDRDLDETARAPLGAPHALKQ